MNRGPVTPRSSGFTLLELVLAMFLLSLLVGMVFSTARSSLALGNAIVKSQNEEMLQQAFFELLNNRFSSLPGNTRFDLKVQDSGSHYISDLTLQNVPLSFTWGGQARIAKAIQLSTVKKRSGYLDVVLRYYENEILVDPASPTTAKNDEAPFAEIVLLTDVAYFEWRVLDGRSMEWQYDWDLQGRLPLQLELTMAIGAKGEEIRQIFWVPPRQNPEILMRQMVQSGGEETPAGPNGTGGPAAPGVGGVGISLPGGSNRPPNSQQPSGNPRPSGNQRPSSPRRP